jgi:hypothetical protein
MYKRILVSADADNHFRLLRVGLEEPITSDVVGKGY